jgi:hypothetical protein
MELSLFIEYILDVLSVLPGIHTPTATYCSSIKLLNVHDEEDVVCISI